MTLVVTVVVVVMVAGVIDSFLSDKSARSQPKNINNGIP